MQDNNHQRRSSVAFIAGVIAAVLATGGGAAWWALNNLTQSPQTTSPNPTESPVNQESSTQQRGAIYWLDTTGDRLKLKSSPVIAQKSLTAEEVLRTALEGLLSGSNTENESTTIPPNTKLLSLKLDKEGVHLNLSSEFTTGGGSASMTGRLAQLLYTATSLEPKAKVWLSVDGKPLDVLGGEGLMIEQPMTRQWFEENFEL
ncbi:GerMN domain-containing protein [Crocosphaera sp. UHCC 0190]|uniref:GerMN domain-containing protein n=1 Tax=Crocosphaera sp. UHCC 0190 TaxID=3110246 RepID=UPI002B1F8370|nr:GerMN domain-containing protein [Crocosphaera sp. UHCC 0190]MEA5510280.1 GerMN domain-containing protein [Crocosphaera sp. UHCC 0190]